MQKEFKSHYEQIKILKSKGLIVNNIEHAVHSLKHIGYFALINGYKKPFKAENGRYKEGTHFEDIEQLYKFDEKLRLIILEHILLIERRVKASLSYHFSEDFKEVNGYINADNYNYSGIQKIQEIIKLVSILINIYNDNQHSYIKHYKDKHCGEIPLWVVINAMTFGQVSKMYSLLKTKTQQKVCGDFHLSSPKDFEKMLNMITLFRNVCAHNERLYDYETKSGVGLDYLKKHIEVGENTYENERKRLFGFLVCCRCLINGREGKIFFESLENFINKSSIIQNPNIGGYIIKEMGLPLNWANLKG
ncbi:MAG: Abi family protein [Firmicutes bacterium]|nr:Abi family protein [[Eubacterium] siraeum]MCM1486832.1 Abi family protein [Bacillota bacterium]